MYGSLVTPSDNGQGTTPTVAPSMARERGGRRWP